MYIAMLFFPTYFVEGEGETKEAAILNAEYMAPKHFLPLTFRPKDGTVYGQGGENSHIPIGVVFRKEE
jgi:hypothetical protein